MKKLHASFAWAALLIFGSALMASPAAAKHDEHGHGWKHGKKEVVVIENSDRRIIHGYLVENYPEHCPPGLAKKHNGCLPPGLARKVYMRGDRLPGYVHWETPPRELLVRLRPPPSGAEYVLVNRNMLLISDATREVLDAVTLLSAVR